MMLGCRSLGLALLLTLIGVTFAQQDEVLKIGTLDTEHAKLSNFEKSVLLALKEKDVKEFLSLAEDALHISLEVYKDVDIIAASQEYKKLLARDGDAYSYLFESKNLSSKFRARFPHYRAAADALLRTRNLAIRRTKASTNWNSILFDDGKCGYQIAFFCEAKCRINSIIISGSKQREDCFR
jgi:hypothetical protein